jgi:hypothetical protein
LHGSQSFAPGSSLAAKPLRHLSQYRWRRQLAGNLQGRTGPHFGFAITVDARDADTAWVVPSIADDQRTAAGSRLRVYRTQDGGGNWEKLSTGLPQTPAYDVVLRQALTINENQLAFASTTGNAYASRDGGESWHCLGNHYPPVYSLRFG